MPQQSHSNAISMYVPLLRELPQVAVMVTRDGTVQYANRPFLGFETSQLQGQDICELLEGHDDNCQIRGALQTVFQSGATSQYEHPGPATEEGRRWFRITICPVGSDNRIVAAIAFIDDITEHKRIQRRQHHLTAVLRCIRNVNQYLIREQDTTRLPHGACTRLVESRGYAHCWIAVQSTDGTLQTAAEANVGHAFAELRKQLSRGDVPPCVRRARKLSGTAVIPDPAQACHDCRLHEGYEGRAAMCTPMRHHQRIYGYLTVALSPDMAADKEEQSLLEELAGDIAYALHSLEDDRRRRQAERQLEQKLEELQQRTKELDCLYCVSRAAAQTDATPEQTLQSIVQCIPSHYRYSEAAEARIIIHDRSFSTARFEETKWMQEAVIRHHGRRLGSVQVCYLTIPSEVESQPFLAEEQALLDAVSGHLTSIWERLQTNAALQESEAKFRAISSSAHDAIVLIDDRGIISYCNPAIERVSGYTPEKLVGQRLHRLLAPARFRHQADSGMERFKLEGSGPVVNATQEVALVCRDGSERPVELSVSSVQLGGTWHALGIMRDISDRRAAEQDRRIKETAMSSAVNSIALADLEGRLTYVNEAFLRFWGYDTPEEALGRSVVEFWEDPAAAGAVVEALQQEGAWVGELVARRRDGDLRHLQLSANLVTDDRNAPLCLMGSFVDVTARVRAEHALREAYTIINRSPVVAFLWKNAKDWPVEYVSENVTHLVGYSAEDLTSGTVAFVELIHPDDLTRVSEEVARHSADPDCTHFVHEPYRLLPKDGETIWVEDRTYIRRDATGVVTHYEGLLIDVTDRMQAEAERSKLVEELKRSNEELEQFAYVASHDLQEPLRMVASYLQLLSRRYQDQLDDTAQEFMAFAVDGAQRMRTMISDLLTYSRVHTRGGELVPVSLEEIINNVLAGLQLVIEENDARVTHDPLPQVLGDGSQLHQLFQNLIANAIKYRGESPPRVHVKAVREGHIWRFSVQDNGIGFDQQYADRVFRIFQRLHTRDQYSGTGIGLAVSKRIVERHGGRIWVESAAGKGSTFFFTLLAAP